MQRQVAYHLVHARAAASAAAPGTHCALTVSLEPLVRTMHRLYSDRGLRIEVGPLRQLAVAVERQDLDEMLGNLVDNACKWARHRIVIVAGAVDGGRILVAVEDDGDGLPEMKWTEVLGRGVRADESTAGSGLGLAITRDVAELYGGTLTLGRSESGGLRAELRLPAA